ncbi:MATE family efflux transporter [Brumicola nitratireducens]|uniref:Multidrug-efflux transporter n=1 Tax=Glaciecola nitratireducens (strain JCM 12485 / KCTC 12276 / FR1064) TaxID=1085623 RepID=G4QHM5_GLANF|nr:MATE efflux family protein [Glaciecola nitratireducens FR1064]
MNQTITKQAFLTEMKTLLTLAWPLLIAQVTQTLMGVSDTIMAGRYSYTDMAAVAIGFSITMPVLMFIQGVTLGLSPIISRLQGSKQTNKVANALHQCIWLSLILSAFALLLIFVVVPLLENIEMEAAVRTITVDYIIYILLAAPGFALYQSLRNCCEGLSSTRPTMIIMFAGLLVNIPANYILINGLFGLPEMGGAGCGLATLLVIYVMAFVTLLYMMIAKKLKQYDLFTKFHWPKLDLQLSQLKIGLPIAFTIVFEVTLFGVVAVLLARFGAEVVASHQIALNFSSLMFMLPMSIGMAVAIRIGYSVGNEDALNAKISVYCALVCSIVIALFTATMTVILSTEISALYTENQGVIMIASSLLFFAALFQFSDGIQVVSANALRGYKDTKAMLILSFVSYWLVGLPVGIILGLTDWFFPVMAAKGFWIGFISGLSCAAVLMFWRVKVIQKRVAHDVKAYA